MESHVHRLVASSLAGAPWRMGGSWPQPRLETVRHPPNDRLYETRDRTTSRDHAERAGDHEHDGHLCGPELLEDGARIGCGFLGQLSHMARAGRRLAAGEFGLIYPRHLSMPEGW